MQYPAPTEPAPFVPAPAMTLDEDALLRALEAAGFGLFRHAFDAGGRLVDLAVPGGHWSLLPAACFGGSGSTVPLGQFIARCDPVHAEAGVRTMYDHVARGAATWQTDFPLLGDAQTRWIRMDARVQRDPAGRPLFLEGTLRDVSGERRAQHQLQQLQDALRRSLEAGNACMFHHPIDPEAKNGVQRINTSDAWQVNSAAVYGYPPGHEMTVDDVMARLHPDDQETFERAWQATLAQGGNQVEVECRLLMPDGQTRWLLAKMHYVLATQAGETGYVSGMCMDITERKRTEERIAHMATHDALTGLPNRALCGELVQRAIEQQRRYDRPFALMFVDLDRFKIINDTLGHEAGDELLLQVSQRFRKALRASDMVARLGGDEFVVMADECAGPEQAAAVARELLSAALTPFTLAGQECRVTASIGIVLCPRDGSDEQTLLKHADIAMYHAKEEGKNNFQFYSPALNAQSLERLTLESALRRALECGEFTLHYQPKIDFAGGHITGSEALLRWDSATLGAVSPTRFIPVAEDTGLIVPIGRWVLREACEQAVRWQRAGLAPLPVAVNLSARQFADDGLYDDIVGALHASGLDPRLLEIELTEGMVMHNVERASELLCRLKERGVRVAIDDFGTGYSSLAQIRRFPIDTLKVDRSFVRGIQGDAEGQAIADAIIAMGHSLSLTVIAEGVETPEEAQFLRSRRCDEMQGYHFSKPLPAAAFEALVRDTVPQPLAA
jgi:diguanylate cyclase (GGDEF)-like protein/PAS domain S-box-containing protein